MFFLLLSLPSTLTSSFTLLILTFINGLVMSVASTLIDLSSAETATTFLASSLLIVSIVFLVSAEYELKSLIASFVSTAPLTELILSRNSLTLAVTVSRSSVDVNPLPSIPLNLLSSSVSFSSARVISASSLSSRAVSAADARSTSAVILLLSSVSFPSARVISASIFSSRAVSASEARSTSAVILLSSSVSFSSARVISASSLPFNSLNLYVTVSCLSVEKIGSPFSSL